MSLGELRVNSMATSFTGTLVRRQYKRGQPFVQLVFKNGRQTRLSLSRNAQLIQFLKVGRTYRISGAEYAVGGKTFIRDPKAQLAPSSTGRFQKRWILAGAGALLFVVAGVFAVGHFSGGDAVQAVNNSSVRPAVKVAASVLGADTATPPAAAAAADTTPPVVPIKSTVKTTAHTAVTSPAPQPQIPAPAAPQTPAPVQPDTAPPADNPAGTTPVTPPADTATPPADTTPPPAADPPVTPPPTDTPPPTP
jgi:hypothetical protein